jgi:hypothetical protein
MPAEAIADFFKAGTVFAALPTEEILALAAVAREDRYRARDYIFMEGDASAWFWLGSSVWPNAKARAKRAGSCFPSTSPARPSLT